MTDTGIPQLNDEPTSSTRTRDARPRVDADARARVGQVIGGKYRLDEAIGSGGMGDVYRATNTDIGRTVAIKVLRREHVSNTEIVERFSREARTTNRIRHPNVVEVTDLGRDDDGCPYIVQEYLEGMTLLDYAARSGGKIPIADLADILGPVLSAIAEAHELSIVHRDLKPENVFLSTGRRGVRVPKVLDFGISKVRTETEQTRAGVMMGTPAYMAPELIVSWRDASVSTDVWSIGVIIFEMLTGKLPFEGDTVGAMMRAVMTEDARRLCDLEPDLPKELSDIIEKCLRRDPTERYADAKVLGHDLMRVLSEIKPAVEETVLMLSARSMKVADVVDLHGSTLPALEPQDVNPQKPPPDAPTSAPELSGEDTLPADIRPTDDVVLAPPSSKRTVQTAKNRRARDPHHMDHARRTKRSSLTKGDRLAIAGTLVMLALAILLFVLFLR